jgi:hypothetical protein
MNSDYISRAIEIRDQAICAGVTCPHAIAALILSGTIALVIEEHVGYRLDNILRTLRERW